MLGKKPSAELNIALPVSSPVSHDVGSFAYVPLQQYHSKPPKQLRAAERARCLPKPGLVAHDRPG